MRHIAIVGSGPAGYYTAEAALKLWGSEVRIDVFDALPVPYGLIRTGVAPDHQSIKAVARRFEKTALNDNVRFVGNVKVGANVNISALRDLYHAVVLATGAPRDSTLDIPGRDLTNVFGSAAFVGWYNGHPEFADLAPDLSGKSAVVIGMGNVALDVARILAKTRAEFQGSDIVDHALSALDNSNLSKVTIVGRRGPHQIMMTPKELGELLHLEQASPRIDPADLPAESADAHLKPGMRKSVGLLRSFADIPEDVHGEKSIEIDFDLFASPVAFHPSEAGPDRVSAVEVEETTLENEHAVGTGKKYRIAADLVITCIGYRTSRIPDVPFDECAGRFANDEGRILPGLYCVGWARRGPSGTIGTNRPDGYAIADLIEADLAKKVIDPGAKAGGDGFDAFAAQNNLDLVRFSNWQKIDEAEIAAARDGSPREKIVDVAGMIAAGDR